MPPSLSGEVLSALSGSRSGSTWPSSEPGRPDEGIELLGGRVAHERAERVRERAERQPLAAHLDAAARKDPRARGARALSGLLDEPRLAHPGLATQEHHRRIPRDSSVQRRGQRRQLGVSADEDRTDQSASHRAHVLSLRRGRLGEHRQTRRHTRRGTTAIWTRRTRLHPRAYRHRDARVARCGAHPGGRVARVRRLLCSPVTAIASVWSRHAQRTSEPSTTRRQEGRGVWSRAAPTTAWTVRMTTDCWPLCHEGTSWLLSSATTCTLLCESPPSSSCIVSHSRFRARPSRAGALRK